MSIQNFIPEIWDAGLLMALHESHIFAQPTVVNRDYEGQVTKYGDVVHIAGMEPVNIRDYARYQDVIFEEIELNKRTIRIDQARSFGLAIDDLDEWQAQGDVMGPAMYEAGYAMSRDVDLWIGRQMADSVDPRNVREIEVASGTTDAIQSANGKAIREVFVSLRTRLRRNNVPDGARWAIVSPEVYAHLLLDPHFIKADERGASSVVESSGNGVVGAIYGFTIIESNNVPTKDAGLTHQILAGTNQSYSFAEAITKVEPVRFERKFVDGVKGLHVFGGHMVRPEYLCMVNLGGIGEVEEPVSFRDPAWVGEDRAASNFPRVTGNEGFIEKPATDEKIVTQPTAGGAGSGDEAGTMSTFAATEDTSTAKSTSTTARKSTSK